MKKIVGTLILIGILFSYFPVHSMANCEEDGHKKSMTLDCGYFFHCPLIMKGNIPELLPLPLIGQLDLILSLPIVDELPHLIYRPPEFNLRTVKALIQGDE